jgi:uncharacterized protein YndB with AHSA1/START domain
MKAIVGPVRALEEIVIQAPIETVWETLTGLDAWPKFRPGSRLREIGGAIDVDRSMLWKFGPLTMAAKLVELDSPQTIVWTARAFGVAAARGWHLSRVNGQTQVHTEELWKGPVTAIFPRRCKQRLELTLHRDAASLKEWVENRGSRHGSLPQLGTFGSVAH